MRIVMMLFLLNFLHPSEIKLATSQHSFQNINNSDIYFHLHYNWRSLSNFLSTSAQWWPSDNLYLSGTIATIDIDDDKALYHNMSVGYSNPIWKTKTLKNVAIDVGVHRLRFYNNAIYRWFHGGIITRFNTKLATLGIDFTRYFHNDWATSRYTITIEKSVNKVNIKGGIIQDNFHSFSPFIGMSIGI